MEKIIVTKRLDTFDCEDLEGLYCKDACGGDTNKRHIYKTEHSGWDTSLIKELGFRKIKLVN